MLLGKRPRPPMRRTTSLTEFSGDVGIMVDGAPLAPAPAKVQQDQHAVAAVAQQYCWPAGPVPMEGVAVPVEPGFGVQHFPGIDAGGGGGDRHQQFPLPSIHHQHQLTDVRYYGSSGAAAAAAVVSPRKPRRNSGDFQVETAHFLKACGLCNRRLKPGKDIYMYRGEIAFCSSECRQQQMTLDERKEKKKCALTSIKNETPQTSPPSSTTVPEPAAGNGETIAAA